MDLDDAFMFWAIAAGRVDPHDYGFDRVAFRAADTDSLNRAASAGEADVVAVSIAHVPALAPDYLLLPHGGSLGRGYGPVVVARAPVDLAGVRVGIPGETTTAARLLALAAPEARPIVIPFHAAFDALDRGEVDAAVLIHEGRLVYQRLGYRLALDLGAWWHERTGLPLPLGGNVIRRALGPEVVRRASAMCRASIACALAHRDEALDELLRARPGTGAGERRRRSGPATVGLQEISPRPPPSYTLLSHADADAYLRLYANDDTLDYGADGRAAVQTLLGAPVTWAP